MKDAVVPHLQALMEGPDIPLDKPIVLIGRHQECDIQIPSRKISRRHCCLAQVGDHLVVRDLGSTNGVRINGVKVMEGSLLPGDELMLGNIRYKLLWSKDAKQVAAAARQHGIVAKGPSPRRLTAALDSGDMPVALPEVSQSQPIMLAKPMAPGPHHNAD